jgi:hypothetical protein
MKEREGGGEAPPEAGFPRCPRRRRHPPMNQPFASITPCATIGIRCEPRHRLEAYAYVLRR